MKQVKYLFKTIFIMELIKNWVIQIEIIHIIPAYWNASTVTLYLPPAAGRLPRAYGQSVMLSFRLRLAENTDLPQAFGLPRCCYGSYLLTTYWSLLRRSWYTWGLKARLPLAYCGVLIRLRASSWPIDTTKRLPSAYRPFTKSRRALQK